MHYICSEMWGGGSVCPNFTEFALANAHGMFSAPAAHKFDIKAVYPTSEYKHFLATRGPLFECNGRTSLVEIRDWKRTQLNSYMYYVLCIMWYVLWYGRDPLGGVLNQTARKLGIININEYNHARRLGAPIRYFETLAVAFSSLFPSRVFRCCLQFNETTTEGRYSALHLASHHHHYRCIEVLLLHSKKRLDLKMTNTDGKTALQLAQARNFRDVVRIIRCGGRDRACVCVCACMHTCLCVRACIRVCVCVCMSPYVHTCTLFQKYLCDGFSTLYSRVSADP